jgi:CRP/FNR family cyclic AMP-dependent transcriptional regulator
MPENKGLILPPPPARLRPVGIFAAAKASTRAELGEKSTLKLHAPDSSIWHDGDATIVAIQSGRCKLQVMSQEGQTTTLAFLKGGDVAGLIEQSSNKTVVSVCIATSDVSAVHISIDHLQSALERDDGLRNSVAAYVRDEAILLRTRLFQMATLSIPARVAAYLLSELGPSEASSDIKNPLTHEEIASIVGASREAVTRTFRALARLGIVSYSRQNIHVASIQKLKKYVSEL